MERLWLIVVGRVQGVGFRYFVQQSALALGLRGWVRNRWDETVELVAEGERPALEKLLRQVERGPNSAHVSSLQAEWLPATGEFVDFRLKASE